MSPKRRIILESVQATAGQSSRQIHAGLTDSVSYATVKRHLQALIASGHIRTEGNRKSTTYHPIKRPVLLYPTIEELDHESLPLVSEPSIGFNFAIFNQFRNRPLFEKEELKRLNALHGKFVAKMQLLNQFERSREMERLAIDLSWKSAQIEGNTYSLLETEVLLKDKLTAGGKTPQEATMLLNHKDAIDFVLAEPEYLSELSVSRIEDLHALLIKDLQVQRNIRRRGVGITGTDYRPLDNQYQIREALQGMCKLVNSRELILEKALLLLLLISYIQAFNDGNKRTARIVSNAVLIHGGYCPLSFRTVDAVHYKRAMLEFYEKNDISAFKHIFIEQYEFAVGEYF